MPTSPSSSDDPSARYFEVSHSPDPSDRDRGSSAFRDQLRAVRTDSERDPAEKLSAILKVGAEHFGVENGHLVAIDPAQGTHTSTAVSGLHPVINPEATEELSQTYCRQVIAEDAALALDEASSQGWASDPAYLQFELETYLGMKVLVSGELYGTVCFVDREPREKPFEKRDIADLELIAWAIEQQLEQRSREDRLARTRARLEALFEEAPDMINIHDRAGNLIVPNPRLCEKTGRAEEELTRMRVWDLDAELSPNQAKQIWAEMDPGDRFRWEGRYRRADGSTFPVEVDLRCLDLDGEDRFIAIARDITKRKEREQALRREKQRFESLVNEVKEYAIFLLDPEGRVRSWNEGAERIKGYREEEIMGKPFSTFYTKEAREADVPQANLHRAEAAGSTQDEGWRVRKDGTRFWAHVTITALEKEGELSGFAKVTRDMTDRREKERELRAAKEEAEEASRLKSAFLANMSHEIRTPLSSILGFADLLAEETSGPQARHAGRIQAAGDRLLRTLENVLHLARLESGTSELKPEDVDLTEHLTRAAEPFRPKAAEKELEFEVEGPEEPARARLDPGLLERILTNLLSNAVKFTEAGQVRAALQVREEDIELAVTDTGIGMDEGQIGRLLQPFEQASSGLDRRYEGTGIGLTIAARLTERAGGQLDLESEPGKGTRAAVRLPRWAGEGRPDNEEMNETTVRESSSDLRILLVDDDPAMEELVAEMMPASWELQAAAGFEEALEIADRQAFDLLLLDINLKGTRSGTELLGHLRDREIAAQTPAVALTAYAMEGDEESFRAEGFDGYLAKPFSADTLQQNLIQVLEETGGGGP